MIKNVLSIAAVTGAVGLICAAETPTLVADTNPYGAYPAEITSAGGKLFFASRDADHGDELWIFDGQSSRLVADLAPGTDDFSPTELVAAGGRVYFRSRNQPNQHQLWTSSGLATDTYPVFALPRPSDVIVNIAVAGSRVFLRARTGSDEGFSLWASNPQRTTWSKLSTGDVDHFKSSAATAEGKFFYLQFGPPSGTQLWITDGTTNGTSRLTPNASVFGPPVVAGGRAYFNAVGDSGQFQTWTTDGSVAGTRMLSPFQVLGWPAAFGDKAIFLCNDGMHGVEPWMSDGTGAGTQLLADILPGTASGFTPNALYYSGLTDDWAPTYRQAKDVFVAAGGRLFLPTAPPQPE